MKGDDYARIALLKDLCDQAKRLRDDAEALCQELSQQIERAKRTKSSARPFHPDRRRTNRPTPVERRRRR